MTKPPTSFFYCANTHPLCVIYFIVDPFKKKKKKEKKLCQQKNS